jgi:hypothetical protein
MGLGCGFRLPAKCLDPLATWLGMGPLDAYARRYAERRLVAHCRRPLLRHRTSRAEDTLRQDDTDGERDRVLRRRLL